MLCPVCLQESRVMDTRDSPDGTAVRRRRECESCRHRFSTLEEIALMDLTVCKRNGSREAYDREKIVRGVTRALEKRPYTSEQLRQLVSQIERDIQRQGEGEVHSEAIGETVMRALRTFDTVAYIRFASVYRQFEDVETFQEELNALLKRRRTK